MPRMKRGEGNRTSTPIERAQRRAQGKLSPKLQRVRAAKILERKILGNVPINQVAREFNLSESTVRQALTLAERADIVVKFEDKLYDELLPKSYDAVAEALDGVGDVARAKLGIQIMTGTQVLRPNSQRSGVQQAEDDELALYVLAKRKQAALVKETFDGEISNKTVNAPDSSQNLLPGAGTSSPESERTSTNSAPGYESHEIEAHNAGD